MKDLDLFAAKASQDIIEQTRTANIKADNVENLITKALGILQENGVYAALLYLYSRSGDTDGPVAEQARARLLSLLLEIGLPAPERHDVIGILQYMTNNICNNLDRLLLVKQLWEQTLIYTRYGAKAYRAEE